MADPKKNPIDILVLIFSVMTLLLPTGAQAQFGFFEQMFGGGGANNGGHQQPRQNVRSDSSWYQEQYRDAYCTNYLCPDTLACVHFPHHCPCAHPDTQDKVELGEGIAVCASKGGWVAGEMQRKVELARKGLL